MCIRDRVKQYLEGRHRASVTDIAIALSTTADAARSLLEIWRAKQRVRLIAGADDCGGCGKKRFGGCSCSASEVSADVYEWIGDGGVKRDAS